MMSAAARALHVLVIFLLGAAAARAQPAAPLDSRLQALISQTKAGEEQAVPCDRLDPAVGQQLLDAGRTSRSDSHERLTHVYRLAERAARCAGSDALTGAVLNALSDSLYARGQFDAALDAAQESVRIHERINDAAGLAEAWNRVGNVHWWVGDTRSALDAFQQAVDHTPATDGVGRGRAWNNIANVYKSTGDWETALDYYGRALHLFDELGDRARAAVVTNNIANIHALRGEYATALEYSRRALEMNRAIGQPSRLAASLDSQADIHRTLGAYAQALRLFTEALAIRTAADDRLGVMETTHNIGLVYSSQGDDALAIDAYKRGILLNERWHLRDASLVAEALHNIGAAAWRLGQRDRALANLRASLALAEREHLRKIEGAVVNDLGRAALERARPAEALALFDRALAIHRQAGDQAGVTETLTGQAAARLAMGRYELALTLANAAVDNAKAHDQPELLWNAQTVAGVAYRWLGRPDAARAALTEALRTLEGLSASVAVSDDLRPQFLEHKLSPFHELIALLVQRHAAPEALEIAERSKARTLGGLLRRTLHEGDAILTADERRERTRLRGLIFGFNQRLDNLQARQAGDASNIAKIEAERRAARESLAAFETTLAAAHPEVAAARGDVKPFEVADAAPLVSDGTTAILEYVVAHDAVYAFTVTATGDRRRVNVDQRVIAIPAATLAARAVRFRDRIASRDYGVIEDASALYDLLIAPCGSIARAKRIIVIPDGPLWNVPFQALRGSHGYLLETTSVSYAPSIAVLREIRRLPAPSGPRTLLAVGKSKFDAAASPTLEPLPEAEAQVRLIGDVYGAERSAIYTGADATESQFKAAAPRFTVLHLATHALLDEASPMYSHLVLSPGPRGPEDDGRLEAWEIMGMKLRADLVVLAACETGRGRIAPGEGVIGTMWALFAAGARSLVVSQFRVESTSTTALLVGFHRRLVGERGSKAEHLRSAALELLHTPRYAHPYYWAAFVLVGDPD